MASLRKINGRYYAYFYDKHRRPKSKSVALGVRQKAAAEQLLRRKEIEYSRGDFDPWNPKAVEGAHLVDEAFTAFLESRRKTTRKSTYDIYSAVIRQFERGLPAGILVAYLGPEHIEPFVHDRQVQQGTRRMRYERLRACFRWLHEVGYIDRNPLQKLKAPKPRKRVPKFLTAEHLDQLLTTIEKYPTTRTGKGGPEPKVQWLVDLIHVAVSTGLRLGELCAIRWEDIDLDSGFLTVRTREGDFEPKSGDERRVPIAGEAREVLVRLRKANPHPSDYVLTSSTGRRLHPAATSHRFKYFCRLAGLPEYIHFHGLRHTTASRLARNGVSLPIIQAILGHSSVDVTQQYAHLIPEDLAQAMEDTFGIPEQPAGSAAQRR